MRRPVVQRAAIFSFAVAATFLSACSGGAAPASPGRPALVQRPQPLAEGAAEVYPGAVRAQVENELSFRVPGKIATRLVDAGAEVKSAQVLATLDPDDDIDLLCQDYEPEPVVEQAAAATEDGTDFAAVRLRLELNQLESVLERTDGARIELAVSQAAFKYRYAVIRPAQVPRSPPRTVALKSHTLSLPF